MFKKIMLFTLLLSTVLFAYIGNVRSYKFHEDECQYVYCMSECNKIYSEDRDYFIDEGFVPCKVCRP